jgi:hypothetical protein
VCADMDSALRVDLTTPVVCVCGRRPADARSSYRLDLDREPAKGGAEADINNDGEEVCVTIVHETARLPVQPVCPEGAPGNHGSRRSLAARASRRAVGRPGYRPLNIGAGPRPQSNDAASSTRRRNGQYRAARAANVAVLSGSHDQRDWASLTRTLGRSSGTRTASIAARTASAKRRARAI